MSKLTCKCCGKELTASYGTIETDFIVPTAVYAVGTSMEGYYSYEVNHDKQEIVMCEGCFNMVTESMQKTIDRIKMGESEEKDCGSDDSDVDGMPAREAYLRDEFKRLIIDGLAADSFNRNYGDIEKIMLYNDNTLLIATDTGTYKAIYNDEFHVFMFMPI